METEIKRHGPKPSKPDKKGRCCIGCIDCGSNLSAEINQVSICVIMCGSNPPGNICLDDLAEPFDVTFDKNGDLMVNGEHIKPTEIGDDMKIYAFKKEKKFSTSDQNECCD